MKRKNSYVLDENDDEAVQLFSEIGMPKNLAKTLMYVSQVDECISMDIEHGASLRQPEVSVAMQELRRRGWAKKHDRKKEGKGRPLHIYKHNVDLSKVIEVFERKKIKEFEGVKKDLSELKTLVEKKDILS